MPTHILPIGVGNIASFSADDRVLLGEGLFETIRVEQCHPVYSTLHWQRMSRAAKYLDLSFDLSHEMWHAQLIQCIQAAQIQTGGIKVILGGGRAPRGLVTRGQTTSISFEGFHYSPSEKNTFRLISAGWLRDAKNPIYQLKSVNYLESILARQHALACGADDALFFNLDHFATETTVANLFVVKNDKIVTPAVASGLLAGIMRERVLNLGRDAGIVCVETEIDSAMIKNADAVFVTNVLQGIQPVASLDSHNIPTHHRFVSVLHDLLAKDAVRYC